MNVLGISAFYHDAAAAVVDGSGIVAAAQEERFSRIKGDWHFPQYAIEYCLNQLNRTKRPDLVAFYENPQLKAARILTEAAETAPQGSDIWPATLRSLSLLSYTLPAKLLQICSDPDRVRFVAHHRSHAASAFFPSPFDRAAILVVDGVGEKSTATIWLGEGNKLSPLYEIRYPHSLGLLYSAFTQYCGFKVNSGEYKLMGLAPFGSPIYEQTILDTLIDLRPDGSFKLNLDYFGYRYSKSTITPAFETLFGASARKPGQRLDKHIMDVAASAQAVIERCMLRLAQTALKAARVDNLCLAGGVALNCVSNSRLAREISNLNNLWIQPAAGDAGGALGAALQVRVNETTERPIYALGDAMKESLLGPSFEPAEIEEKLRKRGLTYTRPASEKAFCKMVAKALVDGQIVGHFDGRMEFGPRALGNRSILADPRQNDSLSRVNRKIKFREGWRPFAPIVLEEKSSHFFDEPSTSPYMLLVSKLKSKFLSSTDAIEIAMQQGTQSAAELQSIVNSEFPAISHVDGSSRLQTIGPASSSRSRKILEAFYEISDCPMLLNTSFNVRGEPIVCSPTDAIDCFLDTHMDMLAIGPFLLDKKEQSDASLALVGKRSFNAD
jgi:carbamoyltransferase